MADCRTVTSLLLESRSYWQIAEIPGGSRRHVAGGRGVVGAHGITGAGGGDGRPGPRGKCIEAT